jgi:hypothetical protein
VRGYSPQLCNSALDAIFVSINVNKLHTSSSSSSSSRQALIGERVPLWSRQYFRLTREEYLRDLEQLESGEEVRSSIYLA